MKKKKASNKFPGDLGSTTGATISFKIKVKGKIAPGRPAVTQLSLLERTAAAACITRRLRW